MSKNARDNLRTVCCAIPYSRDNKVLVISSRKDRKKWILPKGGLEADDKSKEAAAEREALEEAGVRGKVSRHVTTTTGKTAIYHFYELEVKSLDDVWLEKDARDRKWVSYSEAVELVEWKKELADALKKSSLASSSSSSR